MHDQMYNYLRSRGILTVSQSAFQKLCSTVTSLIDSTEFWYENIDHKPVHLAIFLDFKDTVETHKILLEKLEAYGIRELKGNWFRSNLEGRQKYCKLNCYESRAKTVTCRIPKDPDWTLFFFIVYLNV